MRQRLTKLCIDDQWPAAVTDCVTSATDAGALGKCFEALSKQQQDHISQAIEEINRR